MGYPYKCENGHDITNVSQVYKMGTTLYCMECDGEVLGTNDKDDLADAS